MLIDIFRNYQVKTQSLCRFQPKQHTYKEQSKLRYTVGKKKDHSALLQLTHGPKGCRSMNQDMSACQMREKRMEMETDRLILKPFDNDLGRLGKFNAPPCCSDGHLSSFYFPHGWLTNQTVIDRLKWWKQSFVAALCLSHLDCTRPHFISATRSGSRRFISSLVRVSLATAMWCHNLW